MARYIARTIKGALYNRASGVAKLIADAVTVTYPDLELLSDTLRGAGINGEIDYPTYTQLASAQLEVSTNGLSDEVIAMFGQKVQHLEHRFVSSVVESRTGESEIVDKKIIFKGAPKKLGLGSIEANKAEESSISFEMLYIKYLVKGEVKLEIDKLNDVCIINGVDYSADIRKGL